MRPPSGQSLSVIQLVVGILVCWCLGTRTMPAQQTNEGPVVAPRSAGGVGTDPETLGARASRPLFRDFASNKARPIADRPGWWNERGGETLALQGNERGGGTPALPAAQDRASIPPVATTNPGEDWNSLSVASSALQAREPLPGQKDEGAEYTRELVQVQWRSGDPIDLYVIRPRNAEKPPVILYLFSYPSETDTFRQEGVCRRFTQDGFAAVGFVSALTGQRYHSRPMREWFVSELQEALVTSAHDVQMILNYLSSRGDLDTNRVGMFGSGSGATIAVLAAAADARIKALDLLNPWGDWTDWLAKSSVIPEAERPDYLKPEFQKRVAFLDPIQWLGQLGSRPVRLQDVMDDPVTPLISKQRIESAAPPSVKIVRYQDRRTFGQSPSAEGGPFRWIKEQVGMAAPSPKESSEKKN